MGPMAWAVAVMRAKSVKKVEGSIVAGWMVVGCLCCSVCG